MPSGRDILKISPHLIRARDCKIAGSERGWPILVGAKKVLENFISRNTREVGEGGEEMRKLKRVLWSVGGGVVIVTGVNNLLTLPASVAGLTPIQSVGWFFWGIGAATLILFGLTVIVVSQLAYGRR